MIPIHETTTDEGYPELQWVQQLQKTTRGKRAYKYVFFGSALLGGMLGFFIDPAAAILGALFGTAAGTALWNNMMASGSEKSWQQSAVTKDSAGRAWVEPGSDGALEFFWEIEDVKGDVFGDHVPVDSFDAFEKCRMDEYFTGPADGAVYGQCIGILLHAKGLGPKDGPKCIAVHDGPVVDIAGLLGALTRTFILSRPITPEALFDYELVPLRENDKPPPHFEQKDVDDDGKPATL